MKYYKIRLIVQKYLRKAAYEKLSVQQRKQIYKQEINIGQRCGGWEWLLDQKSWMIRVFIQMNMLKEVGPEWAIVSQTPIK